MKLIIKKKIMIRRKNVCYGVKKKLLNRTRNYPIQNILKSRTFYMNNIVTFFNIYNTIDITLESLQYSFKEI